MKRPRLDITAEMYCIPSTAESSSTDATPLPTVLHIEDSKRHRSMLRLGLVLSMPVGMGLVQHQRGDLAISYIQREDRHKQRADFHFAFVDWYLPYKSGREVMHSLLQQDDFDGPIVILTPTLAERLQRELSYVGRVMVLRKPATQEEYVSMLRLIVLQAKE